MIFEDGDRVVFIGDSITDCLRTPSGEGREKATGVGFVQAVESFLCAFYPERNIRITNMGVGGENTLAIASRWEKDVFDHRPDWVVHLSGINDLFPRFGSPTLFDRPVSPELYEKTLRSLVEKTLPTVKGMILMTPFYIEGWKEDPIRAALRDYTDAVKRIAADTGCRLVELQPAFDKVMEVRHSASLSGDRIHPNNTGHFIIAAEFLKAIGFDRAFS